MMPTIRVIRVENRYQVHPVASQLWTLPQEILMSAFNYI